MTVKMDDISVIETLRSKTEEIDMNQYLKKILGGYSKHSVIEYLNLLRKQQQATAETFYRNLQAVYNEKEELNKKNEALQCRMDKMESEYKNLSESITAVQYEDSNLTIQDVLDLKKIIAALEEEQKRSRIEKESLENKMKHLYRTVEDSNEKRRQSEQEVNAAKETIRTAKQEAKELRDKVVALSLTLEDKLDEIKYLKAIQSEGEVAELSSHIEGLTNQLATQTEVMSSLNSAVSMKEKAIESLTTEIDVQKQMIHDLNQTVTELQIQNEKLLYANTVFTKQLKEDYIRTIDMIQEKSDITIEKIAAQRKLDKANSKIAMLELKIEKGDKMEQLKECNEGVSNEH